ncbi:MAG: glycoside hydrolase family 98 domain-containing protein [Verrucomicrobiae bacterium]|nr:glycoside hydrolase family 98 domain-containing protein [Verrucomicrobiae bacterium]
MIIYRVIGHHPRKKMWRGRMVNARGRLICCLAFCAAFLGGVLSAFGQPIYEAENAIISGPVVATQYPGYSGSGYADYQNASGDYIEFVLVANSTGTYPIAFRYANGGSTDRPLQLSINGIVVVSNLSFPSTSSSWTTWGFTATNNVTLNAGGNKVRITSIGSNGANVDYLLVTAGGTTNPAASATNAPLRRPISSNQPMWLIHIDSWSLADPQKIINLIPQDIRPYVVMNISLSVNESTNGWLQCEYGYETAKSWLRICAENGMWAMIQPASGGQSHFSDADLTVYEEFYREYPNFIGFNYAEQFWGFGPPLAVTWTQRIAHFVDLMKLNQKYGGYLVVSWCGAYYGASINPIAMMKQNPAFAALCKQSPKNFILEEKYTSNYGFYDIESTCLGTYLSGYCGQYGIRYDNSGWVGYNTNDAFHVAAASAPIIEHGMLTGETVMDGPEQISNQSIQILNNGTTSDGYTMRQWGFFSQLQNVSMDIFRKILDGTIRIPGRREVIDRTKVVIVNDINTGSDQAINSSPQTLFTGLYLMTGDGTNGPDGTYLGQTDYFKRTGQYPAVPTVYQLSDGDAKSFQVQVSNSVFTTRWPTTTAKTNEFNSLFAQEYTGDIYAGRLQNGWVVYNPYKSGQAASGSIQLQYNTCSNVILMLSQYTAGVIKEFSNSLSFYLNNYDGSSASMRTDTINIYGSTSQPTYSYVDRASHAASAVAGGWTNGVFTLTVTHNGPLDINVNCSGTAAGRLTLYTPAAVITPGTPLVYTGPHQYEAENFDYKNIGGNITQGIGTSISNYNAMGYLNFGAGSSASIRNNAITVLKSGTYLLDTKYAVTGANISTIDLYVNGAKVATPVFTQTAALSNWATNEQYINLNAGINTIEFRANGTGASPIYFDNIVVTPAVITSGVVIQENRAGFISVDGTIDSGYSGYTGNGYANPSHAYGTGIDWNLHFESSLTKSLTFRYAGTNDSSADLLVNGTNVAANIQFPSTGALTNWQNVTVYPYIAPGTADVRLQSSTNIGLPFIDYVEVTGGWGGTPPPTGLTAVGGTNQINLSWIASSNAASYNVKRSLTSGGNYTVVASGVATTNFTDRGLAGGATYYYVASAVSPALGEGDDGAEAMATTLIPARMPVADAYVESGNAGVNYGSSTNLLVKNNVAISTRNTYLLFDVHDLVGVSSATLTLMPNRVDDSTVKMFYGVAATNWTEAGITWNNQPAGLGVTFATNTVAVGVANVLDVTSVVKSQATNGGLLAIEITQPTNSLNGLIQFCSKEHPTNSWRPWLQYVIPVNTAPNLAAISSLTMGAGMTLNITNVATDSDIPAQTLTFGLLTAPTNTALNAASGVLTWRPLVAQANTTNPFTVMVTDNGTPSMSATESFVVTVNPLKPPQFSTPILSGGQLVLQATGDSGPDYQIQASTNLANWSVVFSTNSPVLPFTWTNSATSGPMNFFRILAGPPF